MRRNREDGDIRAGAALSYTVTDLTITDNNTKLEWMKQDDNNGGCGSLPGSLDKDCVFTWDEAFAFVASLNAANHAGQTDWRVPNVKELHSIVNYENTKNPMVSAEFDTGCVAGCMVDDPDNACSCTAASFYYSSTSDASDPGFAWFVDGGVVFIGVGSKNVDGHVRAVRGGP